MTDAGAVSEKNEEGSVHRPLSPLPTRIDVEQAFNVYVKARGRVLTHDEKRAAASVAPRRPEPGPARIEQAADAGAPDRSVGVPVPARLEFHRSAGIWRDALPDTRRPGSGASG